MLQNETLRIAQSERQQLAGIAEAESTSRLLSFAAQVLGLRWAALAVVEGSHLRWRGHYGFAPDGELVDPALPCNLEQYEHPLLIEDSDRDLRFDAMRNRVPGELPKFYAGIEILNPDQTRYGVLCVMDPAPRRATGRELEVLKTLGGFIERELVFRSLLRTDPLTGLYNGQHFEVEIAREWRRTARSRSPVSMIYVNVDEFASYNEIYGSERGDIALRKIAERLGQCFLRSGDLLVRHKGDHFIVILPDTGVEPAQMLAEEVVNAVQRLEITHAGRTSGRMSVSLGVAETRSMEQHKAGPVALLERAQAAMQRARASGGNGLAVA